MLNRPSDVDINWDVVDDSREDTVTDILENRDRAVVRTLVTGRVHGISKRRTCYGFR